MSQDPPPFAVMREFPRHELRLRVRLVRDDPFTGREQAEETFTENVSVGGALVVTTLGILKGESIRLRALDHDFAAECRVMGLQSGADHQPRLRLMFVGSAARQASARLLSELGLGGAAARSSAPSA